MMNKFKDYLIELLVVIAIIAILAAILSCLRSAKARREEDAVTEQSEAERSAIQMYLGDADDRYRPPSSRAGGGWAEFSNTGVDFTRCAITSNPTQSINLKLQPRRLGRGHADGSIPGRASTSPTSQRLVNRLAEPRLRPPWPNGIGTANTPIGWLSGAGDTSGSLNSGQITQVADTVLLAERDSMTSRLHGIARRRMLWRLWWNLLRVRSLRRLYRPQSGRQFHPRWLATVPPFDNAGPLSGVGFNETRTAPFRQNSAAWASLSSVDGHAKAIEAVLTNPTRLIAPTQQWDAFAKIGRNARGMAPLGRDQPQPYIMKFNLSLLPLLAMFVLGVTGCSSSTASATPAEKKAFTGGPPLRLHEDGNQARKRPGSAAKAAADHNGK